MRRIIKIAICALIIAVTACFLELICCYKMDAIIIENGRNKFEELLVVINLFIAPCMIVLISMIGLCVWKMFKFTSERHIKVMLLCADVKYMILMLTVFWSGADYLQMGEGYGAGLYLAFVWIYSLVVAGIFLMVLVGILLHEYGVIRWRKTTNELHS